MLEGGEDPRFIARRMVILASEDIGNADPQALRGRDRGRARRSTASACPSARSTSPRPPPTWRWRRSRTPRRAAISAAMRHVREHGAKLPPDYLRDAHYAGREEARPRPGLRLPARRARRRRRPAAAAAGGPGRALLRAHRPRLRGRARERLEVRRRLAGSSDRRRCRRRLGPPDDGGPATVNRSPIAAIESPAMGHARILQPGDRRAGRHGRDDHARAGPGGGRRRRRGAAVLGPALARRSRPLHAPRRRRAGRRHGGGRRPAHPRAGQAAHRELRDGADPDDRRAALVRRTPGRRSSPTRRSPTRRRS